MSSVKLEYCDGEIYAMAGGTPAHADLAAAAIRLLSNALLGRYRVSTSDLKVRIEATGLSTFPDVTVVCGEREVASVGRNATTNPTLLVEVTSKSSSTSAFASTTRSRVRCGAAVPQWLRTGHHRSMSADGTCRGPTKRGAAHATSTPVDCSNGWVLCGGFVPIRVRRRGDAPFRRRETARAKRPGPRHRRQPDRRFAHQLVRAERSGRPVGRSGRASAECATRPVTGWGAAPTVR